jgi:hypothetical protein
MGIQQVQAASETRHSSDGVAIYQPQLIAKLELLLLALSAAPGSENQGNHNFAGPN